MKGYLIPIAVVLLVCVVVVVAVGSVRPFAPSKDTLSAITTPIALTPAPQKADTTQPSPPPAPDVTAQAAPTSETESESVPTATPTGDKTLVAYRKQVAAPTSNLSLDARLTQTSIPAQKTLDAIQARALATSTPLAGPSPTPRVIDQTTNILLLGTDLRPTDPTWEPNTDVMMILFLDTTNQRAALLSFPRDLVVAIPHHEAFRMNFAYHYGEKDGGPSGGAELLKQILHDEFNIRVHHWALVDFSGFQKIIDTLGGIDVRVACPLEDTIDDQHFVIPAGDVPMDYLTAKRYVQSRYSTNDTSRNFRQQRVLWAMFKKALQVNALDRIPTLYGQLKDSVQTDMSLFDMVGLIPSAYALDLKSHPERIHAQVLEYPAVYPWISEQGAWLYMPNYEEINNTLNHIFDAPAIAPAKPDLEECPPVAATAVPTAPATATVTPTASSAETIAPTTAATPAETATSTP